MEAQRSDGREQINGCVSSARKEGLWGSKDAEFW
jgi:hypothetical protein